MTDIVERLRASDFISNRGPDYAPIEVAASALRKEAADEIERLRALVDVQEKLLHSLERSGVSITKKPAPARTGAGVVEVG